MAAGLTLVLVVSVGAVLAAEYDQEFFVAPDGNDTNPGTLELPLQTLEEARERVREHKTVQGIGPGGIAVHLRAGDYPRSGSFVLTDEDSGAPGRPVVWRAYRGEEPRLLGSLEIDTDWFEPVTSGDSAWARLPEDARGQVLEVRLADHGITDYGLLRYRGGGNRVTGALELFVDGIPMQLARWPDADRHDGEQTAEQVQLTLFGSPQPDVSGGWTKSGVNDGVNAYTRDEPVDGVTYHLYRHTWQYEGSWYTAWFVAAQAEGYPGDDHPWWYRYSEQLGTFNPTNGASGETTTVDPAAVLWGFAATRERLSDSQFTVSTDRLGRWTGAEEPWFFGFWKYHWSDKHVAAASIDAEASTVTLAQAPTYGIAAGMPWFAENLLEEISRPGEWYLDRSTGVLYVYPPDDLNGHEVAVSMLEEPLLRVQNAEHVHFVGLSFGMGRGDLVAVEGGDSVSFDLCRFFGAGNDGIRLRGTNHRLTRSEIVDSGDRGVVLDGGDRPSLAAGANLVENTEVHRFGRWSWTYMPGIHVLGVGQRVAHNHVHDAPHSAILFRGNLHLIEFNEIDHVCRFSSDAGAIYAGRHWDWRGTRIEHNFIHDVDSPFPGAGEHGVYLDDCLSGVRVFANLVVDVSGHALMHGGGRDDLFVNNVVARSGTVLASDSRGFAWINNIPGSDWNLRERLHDDGVAYQDEPWCSAFPALCVIPDAEVPEGSHWRYPEGSVFSRNIGRQNDRFTLENNWGGTGTFVTFAEIVDNLEEVDPLFRNEAAGDYRLRPDSVAFALPGFVDIEFPRMGILDGLEMIFGDGFEWGDLDAWTSSN